MDPHHRRPIPQYSYTSLSSSLTRYQTLSGGSSDFPPIAEGRSTPDQLSSRLGTKNRLNTINVTEKSGWQAKNASKSSLKRGSETLNVSRDRPSKRRLLISLNDIDDDMKWLKGEITDMKVYVKEIAEYLKGDADIKLVDILDEIKLLT
ncbi:hypothetical protein CVT25_007885 [Psilocybe cyanescens]|uniref:Uncharacterized protein n=1 Tax=Psilocybe cyanescens TaxID=93625 RepID=A0A409XJJ9_PSICY|nr:hypothetical protein CVT25_007885 [Psilocybe cyanescens]